MTIIVHGATGAQGAPVAAALIRSGYDVTAAVRTPGAYAGGTGVAVDFDSAAALAEVYRGAEGVFVHLPLGSPPQQLSWAEAIVEAVATAKPARVVVSTSGYPLEGADSPHGVLARGLEGAGVSVAVIAPLLFLENLLLPPVTGPVRSEGVLRYPIQADYAVSWCSHLDVADVAARLFSDRSVTGIVGVGAIPGLMGDDLARGFAEHVGREVRFQVQTPEAFGASVEPLFGADGIAPVVEAYRWRQTQLDELIDGSTSAQHQLGLAPRTVAQWLKDVSA